MHLVFNREKWERSQANYQQRCRLAFPAGQVRQPLLDITEGTREDGAPCCLLILKNQLIANGRRRAPVPTS